MAAPSWYKTRHCRSLQFCAPMLSPVISTARWLEPVGNWENILYAEFASLCDIHLHGTTSAFLHRNIRTCPRKIKHLAYTTLVRPILEYASIIWDPHTDSNTLKLETVQRRSARRIMQNYNRHASVTTMLQHLDLPTYTTTTPPPFQNHHAIQNQTPTSQRSNHHLHHTSHPEYSTLQPAICPHRGIQIILLPKHHQTMEQTTTCSNQQHNHTTT